MFAQVLLNDPLSSLGVITLVLSIRKVRTKKERETIVISFLGVRCFEIENIIETREDFEDKFEADDNADRPGWNRRCVCAYYIFREIACCKLAL